MNKRRHSTKWYFLQMGYYAFMILVAIIMAFPIYFALISSVKGNTEIFSNPFVPTVSPVFENYPRAIKTGHIDKSFFNTIYITLSAVLIAMLSGAMASYILAKFRFRGRAFIYVFVVAGMMIPIQTIIIPLAFYLGKLGLFDNHPALILLFTAFQIPMTVFVVTGFMKGFPHEIEEAAVIDGATHSRTLFMIIIPLSAPALVSASIFNFINIWNNLLFPLIFIRSAEKQMLALSLQSFFAERGSDYGGVMAAIVISITPTILAYVMMQERVEMGLMAGAVKG
ncbi:MAG: carbohydrate ABC transporter permease [Clostridiales bacterium]|nr:carbohydrate ABC transporter permease [Bacillota bacterium]NLL55485.1 carbohydrate ABC transporter permease [Clostridiales bacterium]